MVQIECQYIRVVALDDVIDETDVIRSTSARSMLECAKKCDIGAGCCAFHFTQGSKQCVEKSSFSIASRGVPSTGAKYYQVDIASPTCPVAGGGWVIAEYLDQGKKKTFQIRVDSGNYNLQADAVAKCHSFNATLPQVTTIDKLQYYRNNIIDACNDVRATMYYVDGSNIDAADFFAPDAFKTSTGVVLHVDSGLWASGQPNNFGNRPQNCVSLQSKYNRYLNDYYCDEFHGSVICERQQQ